MEDEEDDPGTRVMKKHAKTWENRRLFSLAVNQNLMELNESDEQVVKLRRVIYEAKIAKSVMHVFQFLGVSFFTINFIRSGYQCRVVREVMIAVAFPWVMYRISPPVRWFDSYIIDLSQKYEAELDQLRLRLQQQEKEFYLDEEELDRKLKNKN